MDMVIGIFCFVLGVALIGAGFFFGKGWLDSDKKDGGLLFSAVLVVAIGVFVILAGGDKLWPN